MSPNPGEPAPHAQNWLAQSWLRRKAINLHPNKQLCRRKRELVLMVQPLKPRDDAGHASMLPIGQAAPRTKHHIKWHAPAKKADAQKMASDALTLPRRRKTEIAT